MKVSGSNIGKNLQNVDATKNAKADPVKKLESDSKSASTESLEGSTELKLSAEAQAMAKAKKIASQDGIDEAKVARLQKMIDEGTYKVDASAVADKLVDEHFMLPDA